jgi:hypothetical protein
MAQIKHTRETIDVTYAELVALITASGLTPSQFYRITDYATKHYMLKYQFDVYDDVIITGVTEPLIVQAISNDEISTEAKSELFPQDIIHYDWNPENWKYDLGFAAYNEQVVTGWKGTIYFRHDTKNDVLLGYDFRNVKSRRWNSTISPNPEISTYVGICDDDDGVSNPLDFQDFLTFHEATAGDYLEHVKSVHIQPMADNQATWLNTGSILHDIVFHLTNPGLYIKCVEGIRAGTYFNNNTIVGAFRFNTIGDEFQSNVIGNTFVRNKIGNAFLFNRTDEGFYMNAVGDYCYFTFTGNNFSYNNVGCLFYTNRIGNGFIRNTIQNKVSYLITPDKTAGNKFQNNTIQNGIEGTSSVKLDFTSATYVFAGYNCNIFKASDGVVKLSYIKEDTGNYAQEIVNYNA